MVIQNQSKLGEGLANPTDPHHTPTIIQSSTQSQKTQKPRKPKRKDTQVPQELGDSLVRAATIASSLEAEQDSGNTLQSDKDRLKLNELMALCINLQNRVLDLEKTKTTQHNEIASLKRRVKKLEKKNRSRTHKLKRLYKVGLTARVESYGDEEILGEDASKQGRIDVIDADEKTTLVSVQNVDEEMFDVNVLDVKVINTAKLIVDDAQVSAIGNVVSTAGAATTISTATTTTDDDGDITLAQAQIEIKSTKPKNKGVVMKELGESTTTMSSQLSSQQSQDKVKGILIKPEKPMKMKDQIRRDEETALMLQAEFDEEERLAREKAKKEKEDNIALIETWDDIQAKIDVDH
ncbi:hypothetical protein Tco_1203825 [Tanacetum coccineum]